MRRRQLIGVTGLARGLIGDDADELVAFHGQQFRQGVNFLTRIRCRGRAAEARRSALQRLALTTQNGARLLDAREGCGLFVRREIGLRLEVRRKSLQRLVEARHLPLHLRRTRLNL